MCLLVHTDLCVAKRTRLQVQCGFPKPVACDFWKGLGWFCCKKNAVDVRDFGTAVCPHATLPSLWLALAAIGSSM